MNSHGRRFQASVEITELQGLLNPNGTVTKDDSNLKIRNIILQQTTKDGNPMFLSVTRKWKSPAWQVTYIKRQRQSTSEFTTCPAAYLGYQLDANACAKLYKNFTPEAVEEAITVKYEEDAERMMTPAEKESMEEEKTVANIEWVISLSAMSGPATEEGEVKCQDGKDFKFSNDVSINTTRTHANTHTPNTSATSA